MSAENVCAEIWKKRSAWKDAGSQIIDARCMQLLPHHTDREKRQSVSLYLSKAKHLDYPCILAVNNSMAIELQRVLEKATGMARWYIGSDYVHDSHLILFILERARL